MPRSTPKTSLVVADFIALVALTFGVGLAISLAMAGIVLLLSPSSLDASVPVIGAQPIEQPQKEAPANRTLRLKDDAGEVRAAMVKV